jgi:xanthine dehydrogenase accessory factor
VSQRLYATLAEWLSREAVALATVLDTRGAVPRHRGAQMLVSRTQARGTVGGGRLEAKVIADARDLLARGERIGTVAIDLTGREGAQGICGGWMQVVLRRWQGERDAARAASIHAALSSGQPVTLDADDLGHDSTHTLQPSPRLLIVGAGHCGLALARAAALLDYEIHVVDARAEGYDHADFVGATCHDDLDAIPRCLDTPRRVHAVLLNRDWHADLASLERLAARPPEFIGMMGSRKRIAEVLANLPATCAPLRDHLTAPVGLDLGAETPEEIAVSILAQLIAFDHPRRAGK